MRTDTKFEAALQTFVEGCVRIHVDNMTASFPSLKPDTFSTTAGKRYVRIIRAYADIYGSRTVHCFVDKTNGDVLKAASWKTPAKHARGNIFDEHNGLGRMNEYGPAYLR